MASDPQGRSGVLHPHPLIPSAFAPFGDVIAADTAVDTREINEGHTTRYHDLAALDCAREGGRPVVSLFRSRPKATPLTLTVMERHPLGSQAFVPLSGRSWLVVVAPEGPFDTDAMVAFLAGPEQGVNYHAGVWHHYSLALGGVSDFLVIDRDGPGANCDEIALDPPVRVDLSEVAP